MRTSPEPSDEADSDTTDPGTQQPGTPHEDTCPGTAPLPQVLGLRWFAEPAA